MKAGLELTPDQAKNWPAFEQAVRDMAQLRIERIKAREAQDQQQSQQQAQPPMSPFDRLARRADNMAKSSAALKKVADAGAPLYQSLDDAQKGRFTVLARMLRPHHRAVSNGWRRFGEGYGRGFSGPGYGGGGRMLDQDTDGGRIRTPATTAIKARGSKRLKSELPALAEFRLPAAGAISEAAGIRCCGFRISRLR